MEQENWVVEAAVSESSLGVVHQQRVTIVYGIAQLEREHSVSLHHRTQQL